MSGVITLFAVILVSAPDGGGPGSQAPAVREKRQAAAHTGRALSSAVQEALRRWVRTDDQLADEATRQLLALYNRLNRDRQLPARTRAQLRIRVRNRLLELAEQISRRGVRSGQPRAAPQGAKSVRPEPSRTDNLAQWGGLAAAGLGGGFGPAPRWAGQAAPGFGQQPADYGQQLVELIQRTVAPATWEANGGPGTLYYWKPGQALVVRQTDEVHDQLSDVLQQLRRAGP